MRIDAGINWVTFGTNLAAANFAVAMMALAARGSDGGLEQIIWFVLFGGWAVSPHFPLGCFSLIALYCKLFDRVRDSIFLSGSILIGAFGLVAYVDAMYVHPDAQGALAFLFVPVLQWIAVFVTIGIAAVVGLFRRRRSGNQAN